MAGTPLLSLLHISDLHFGVPPASAGGGPPALWRHLELFDGWLGHNDHALIHLEDFILDHKAESQHLVVTGDLTACGKDDEFRLARSYIEQEIALPSRNTGLRHATALARSIPGNHDHWPGSNRIMGGPSAELAKTFPLTTKPPKLPFAPYPIQLDATRQLTIMGINSDADVRPIGITRGLARGRFQSQLNSLNGVLAPPRPGEIRVLLVHHSPDYKGRRLSIHEKSANALWAFVAQQGIRVILSGHIHRPLGRVRTVTHKNQTWKVLEARCGTTSQTDEPPLGWAAHGWINPGRFPRNSLLVHRLMDHGSRIDWHCDLYWRLHEGFAKPMPLMTPPVTVWRR